MMSYKARLQQKKSNIQTKVLSSAKNIYKENDHLHHFPNPLTMLVSGNNTTQNCQQPGILYACPNSFNLLVK